MQRPECADEPKLLYADEALLAVDKPAGMLSVPGRGEAGRDCVAARVQTRWPDALIVHRLDMATSGVLLMARGAAVQRALSIAFAERQVGKTYEAWVDGVVEADAFDIDRPLSADWPNRPRQMVDDVNGKQSLTRCRVMTRDIAGHRTRLALVPVTGRSHQLRVHLCAVGHPILGDALYAPPDVLARAGRLMLHATSIALRHPTRGDDWRIDSPAPF